MRPREKLKVKNTKIKILTNKLVQKIWNIRKYIKIYKLKNNTHKHK